MKNIAIFASGSGTNAENIINHFSNNSLVKVKLILTNRPQATVIERAKRLGVKWQVFDRKQLNSGDIAGILAQNNIDFIVLAGFLWLVPGSLITLYPERIVNIHPALLPAYGGKGMYGSRVHEAVINNGEKESGITIHWVNEVYDAGDIIFQARCSIMPGETAETLAEKVHQLEYTHFPAVIEELIMKL